ncbi:hypothetical protein [Legionella fairfieldensis]|uniref:hypothetical protein n=1 Tax=Legionella fairfieldensis TaxID=45064 RepID=UPI00048DF805|nr:hypothetical protein [Legionella fairfieldensis]
MRNWLITIVLISCLNLIGCVTQYGNYASTSNLFNKTMANDAVSQLIRLYPPAHTRFTLKQPIKDSFGLSLVSLLRTKGYSVVEVTTRPLNNTLIIPTASSGIDLFYLVDSPIKNRLYRVTLMVGQQSLSRPYLVHNNQLVASGYWVRKE